ncbi:uncharacterized protein QC761_0006280 [Podospora bellae-mahoneyi]|uniref:Uncharacterized protein n=1 Tax=Podospora bellae-mahoneyi TaxID=2093777 RepID=A0ABR0FY02_9PEZI|nr:hypothetical protein QC761_0006280 [Podospora bellae-mahoneyi]
MDLTSWFQPYLLNLTGMPFGRQCRGRLPYLLILMLQHYIVQSILSSFTLPNAKEPILPQTSSPAFEEPAMLGVMV